MIRYKLKEVRQAHGLTLHELALEMGLRDANVHYYENVEPPRQLEMKTLLRFARAVNARTRLRKRVTLLDLIEVTDEEFAHCVPAKCRAS